MKVIYSPETYFKLAKLDFLFPFKQFSQTDNVNDLALGGIYEATDFENNMKKLFPGKFIVPCNDLIPYELCTNFFSKKDSVIFSPICTKNEIDYLLLSNKLRIGGVYNIKKIINSFYALLIDEIGEISNPIRFFDIKPNKIL